MVTTRQKLEITALAVVCVASLRTFWRGTGFSGSKRAGLLLALIVFAAVTLIILR